MHVKFIEPMLPALVEQPPEGCDWIQEIKHDGYRTQLLIQDGKAKRSPDAASIPACCLGRRGAAGALCRS
jgi:hypothetical protein